MFPKSVLIEQQMLRQDIIAGDALYRDQLQILSDSGTAIIWSILSCNYSYRCLEKLLFLTHLFRKVFCFLQQCTLKAKTQKLYSRVPGFYGMVLSCNTTFSQWSRQYQNKKVFMLKSVLLTCFKGQLHDVGIEPGTKYFL